MSTFQEFIQEHFPDFKIKASPWVAAVIEKMADAAERGEQVFHTYIHRRSCGKTFMSEELQKELKKRGVTIKVYRCEVETSLTVYRSDLLPQYRNYPFHRINHRMFKEKEKLRGMHVVMFFDNEQVKILKSRF